MGVGVRCHRGPERHAPLPARLSAATPLGLPSFTPRLRAALSASRVRLEIASRSCCATSAMMPTVRSFAPGRSTAMKRTPLSLRSLSASDSTPNGPRQTKRASENSAMPARTIRSPSASRVSTSEFPL
jgi:hypothetical protein